MAPFAKTGGLADVAGSLPLALGKLGVDVRIGLPFYRMVKERTSVARKVVADLAVPLGDRILPCDVFLTYTEEGVPVYFFERDEFFDREQLYGTQNGDYPDNLERFAFFSHASLLFARSIGFGFDVVHCHDWQTGLIPVYLNTVYSEDSFYSPAASVFTIHNVGYQGLFPKEGFHASGLPASTFRPEGVEYWGKASLLKAGIQYATAITTVSPSYSEEIKVPEFGMGMEGVLQGRSSDLVGILNGVDYRGWDPEEDLYTHARYGVDDRTGKRSCKAALLDEMRLDERLQERPLLAMIARLVPQKGYDLLFEIISDVLQLDVGMVILAAGDKEYQSQLNELARENSGRMAVRIGFDEPLSHRIMAGADMLLVPSRYEPCGLTQIYGLKYGAVPVVRATGGLDDTISQFDKNTGEGNGFKFGPFEPKAFLDQITVAVETYFDSAAWATVVGNGMGADFSWEESALQYLSLYEKSVAKHRKLKR